MDVGTGVGVTIEEALMSIPEPQRSVVRQLLAIVKDQSVNVAVETLTNTLLLVAIENDALVAVRDWFNKTFDLNLASRVGAASASEQKS